jgi:hypothetical protein
MVKAGSAVALPFSSPESILWAIGVIEITRDLERRIKKKLNPF